MIVIRHRLPGRPWAEQEFRTDAEAERFVRGLPDGSETAWGGQEEPCAS
jgi:hypothetical protein